MTTSIEDPQLVAQRRRWAVHLALIVSFVLSLLVLGEGYGTTAHSVVGLAFAALIVAHLLQRRHRLRTLARRLTSSWRRGTRLAASDLVLGVIVAYLIVSGVVDNVGGGVGVFLRLGPMRPIRWHALSAVAALIYLIAHVARRATRLRHSRVR